MSSGSFFDRFVHPYVAMVATVGVAIWFLSFFIAASGLYLEHVALNGALAVLFFFYSGLVGVFGILVIALCAVYLVVLWLLRDVLGVVG